MAAPKPHAIAQIRACYTDGASPRTVLNRVPSAVKDSIDVAVLAQSAA